MIGREDIADAENRASWEYGQSHGIDVHAAAAHMRLSLERQTDWWPTLVTRVALDNSMSFEDAGRELASVVWAQGFIAGVVAGRIEKCREHEEWPDGEAA